MKNVLLTDPRNAAQSSARIWFPDVVAAAAVRSGVAVAVNPAEQDYLADGPPVDPGSPIDAIIAEVVPTQLRRIVLPAAVLAVAVSLGVGSAICGSSDPGSVRTIHNTNRYSTLPTIAVTGFAEGFDPLVIRHDALRMRLAAVEITITHFA